MSGERQERDLMRTQLTHRIIPAGDSRESASSQVTGPSRVQGNGYRNNPGIGVIPVGGLGVHVAQVGRQQWQQGLHVGAGPVPVGQGTAGKAVPQVVDPWPALLRPGTDASMPE